MEFMRITRPIPVSYTHLDVYKRQELGQAKLFYRYKDEAIRYTIYSNNGDSSIGAKAEDDQIEEYILDKNGIDIKVESFQKPEEDKIRRVASFEYQGIQYELKGVLEKEILEKIIKNLFFSKNA